MVNQCEILVSAPGEPFKLVITNLKYQTLNITNVLLHVIIAP